MPQSKCRAKTRSGNSYADRHDAAVACNRLNGQRKPGKVKRNPIEPFLCKHCGRWHIGKSRLTRQWEQGRKREG
jgi:hypothetical protein